MMYCRRCGEPVKESCYGCKSCDGKISFNHYCEKCGLNMHTVMFPKCGWCMGVNRPDQKRRL